MALLSNFWERLGAAKGLKARVARGGIWSIAGLGIERTTRLLRNIVLARILTPDAFGIVAIVLAITAAFESFSEIGIQQAVIQNRKGDEPALLNAALWIALSRAVLLYIFAFAAAGLIARFYENAQLLWLIRAALLATLFKGAMSPRYYIAMKRLDLKKVIFVDNGGGLIGISTAIILAVLFRSAWALILGFVVEAAARSILSYLVCPYFPRFNFRKEHTKALLRYMGGILGLPIVTFIFMRTDVFVIGKLLSPTELGIYSLAIALAQLPSQSISYLIDKVALPAFSEIQEENAKLNSGVLDITYIIASLYIPMLFFVVLYGKEILLFAYGMAYSAAAVPFAIVFISWFFRLQATPLVSVYFAIGRPGLNRLFTGFRALLIVLLIYPAVKKYGLSGAAAAGLVSMLAGYVLQVVRTRSIIGLNLKIYSAAFLKPIGISMVIVFLWILTKGALAANPALSISLGLSSCLIAYVITAWQFFTSRQGKGLIGFAKSG